MGDKGDHEVNDTYVYHINHPTMSGRVIDEGKSYWIIEPVGPDVQRFIGGSMLAAVPKWDWKLRESQISAIWGQSTHSDNGKLV